MSHPSNDAYDDLINDCCDIENDVCMFDLQLGKKRARLFRNEEHHYIVEQEKGVQDDYHLQVLPSEVMVYLLMNDRESLAHEIFGEETIRTLKSDIADKQLSFYNRTEH